MQTRNRRFLLTPVLGLAMTMTVVVAVPDGPVLASNRTTAATQPLLTGEIPARPGVLALNLRGLGRRQQSAHDRFVYTTDLYSMTTGERVGTGTHDIAFTAHPLVLDHYITFRLPEGEITSHQPESIGPDPQRRGAFLIGIHPEGNTLMADRGTGAYAGRTGRVVMAGYHDAPKFPEEATFNDFYLIELDPK